MKKLYILAIVAISTAAAAATPTVSDNASSNACFGQARAWYSMAGFNGEIISLRRGANAQMNADYRDSCQG